MSILVSIMERLGVVYECKSATRAHRKHKWCHASGLSGIYHHGAVSRRGRFCPRCNAVEYEQTDKEFIDSLCKHARFVLTDPETTISKRYDGLIPDDVLQEREENILEREKECVAYEMKRIKDRLDYLEERAEELKVDK